MKPSTIILTISVLIYTTGCAGYTYNGIRSEDIRHPTVKSISGALTSLAIHCAGHIIASKLTGHGVNMNGLNEEIEGRVSDSDGVLFAMGGNAVQLAVGYGMKFAGIDNEFSRGYNSMAMVEIVGYPVINKFICSNGDDLRYIESHNGDANLFWGVSSILAVGLNTTQTH